MDELNTTGNKLPTGNKTPLFSRTLLLFMFAMVLANMGGNMYGPLLPLYLKSLQANVIQVGLFFTLSRIVPLALQILGGWISDSLGRLRSIALGSLAGMLSYVGLILAPTWEWVLLSEGLLAITGSLIGPSFPSFIAEQSTEENRARVFAIADTIFMVVGVVGPPLGGMLAGAYGFKLMLICAASVYFVATLIRLGMARAAARTARKNGEAPRSLSFNSLKSNLSLMGGMILAGGVITWILITDGVLDTAFSLSFNLMPLYLEELGGLSIQQIGWLQSVFGICMMAVTIPAGWLADKKSERLAIVLGFLLWFFSLVVFLQADGFLGFALSWVLAGLGNGVSSPAYQSLITKAVPEKIRGTAFGLFHTSLGLVSLPAPAIGAQLWERFSPRLPFMITAGATLLGILPAWLKFKLPGNAQSRQVEGGAAAAAPELTLKE